MSVLVGTVSFPEFDGLSYAGIVAQFGERYPGLVDIVDLNNDEIRFLPVPDPRGSGIGALQRVGQEGRSTGPPSGIDQTSCHTWKKGI